MKYILTIFLSFSFLVSFGQSDTLNSKQRSDSILNKILEGLPKESHQEIIEANKKMSDEQRSEMLMMMDFLSSMPISSKKQLIQNVDTNYSNILALKTFFKSIVPSNYSIYIEFKQPEKILKLDESIDFWVFRNATKTNNTEVVFQEWNIELKSKKLDSLLSLTTLTRKDLIELKKYIEKANCISVSNREEFEIGFARSGMGKYSYLIFDKPLSKEEQKKYNDGCYYIFYKDNIVLEYGGGAIGSQCFPDRE
jgi:hypothetical protein